MTARKPLVIISGITQELAATDTVAYAGSIGWFTEGYTSGNYYLCNSYAANSTSAALANGTVRATPWIVTAPVTLSMLWMEFTAAGDNVSVFRLGIWNDSGSGRPGTLALDAGTISTGTSNSGTVATGGTPGVYEIAVSITLQPGLYWVGGAVQGVTTTQPTIRTVSTGYVHTKQPLGTSLPVTAFATVGFAYSGQTGAFGTFSGAAGSAGLAPRIGFKVA